MRFPDTRTGHSTCIRPLPLAVAAACAAQAMAICPAAVDMPGGKQYPARTVIATAQVRLGVGRLLRGLVVVGGRGGAARRGQGRAALGTIRRCVLRGI